MPTRFIQRRSALNPNDDSRANANAIFVDSDDDQLKFTTGTSGQTTVDVVTETQTQTLTNKTLTSPTFSKSYTYKFGKHAKVGATAGWVLGGADNLPYVATMAQNQTAGTLVIPVDWLQIGATITGYRIIAQVESGGNTVTIDAALRAVTNVAAEPTDAAITGGSITQVSVTADTAVSQAVTGIAEVVATGKSYYILVTATTGASTDIILQHGEFTITEV